MSVTGILSDVAFAIRSFEESRGRQAGISPADLFYAYQPNRIGVLPLPFPVSHPSPSTSKSFVQNPVEGVKSVFEHANEPAATTVEIAHSYADQGLGIVGASGYALPNRALESVSSAGFVPLVSNFVGSFKALIDGVQEGNPEPILQNVENVLTVSAEVSAESVKFAGIAAGELMVPGLGIATNSLALIEGLQSLFRTYQADIACKSIFALLTQQPSSTGTMSASETRTGILQTAVNQKLAQYNASSDKLMASLYWVAYKYSPGWMTNARTTIYRIGLPALGLAVAIVSLLTVVMSVATFGGAAIALTVISASVAAAYFFYKGIKAFNSSQVFQKFVAPSLSPEEQSELEYCRPITHKFIGATMGDFFRYRIGIGLAAAWLAGYICDRKSLTKLNNPDYLNGALLCAVWDIIHEDIGTQKAGQLLKEAKKIVSTNPINYRLALIKLFVDVLRKNR